MFDFLSKRAVYSLLLCVAFLLLYASISFSADHPTTGMVYNTKETSSLTYDCKLLQDNSLLCNFVQTSVRNNAKESDLPSVIQEAKKEFHGAKDELSGMCGSIKELELILSGKKKLNLNPIQRGDMAAFINALKLLCRDKSEKNYLKFIEYMHDKDTRTCRVSSNSFQQTFLYVSDYSGKGAWTTNGTPSGICGVVQLCRFESVKTGTSGIEFWTYYARKAVTNPKGEIIPGMPCSGLDEDEYFYDWRSKEYAKGCDYINFTPL